MNHLLNRQCTCNGCLPQWCVAVWMDRRRTQMERFAIFFI